MQLRTTARVDKGRNGKEPIESDKRMMYEQVPVRGEMKSFRVYICAYKFFLKLALLSPRSPIGTIWNPKSFDTSLMASCGYPNS